MKDPVPIREVPTPLAATPRRRPLRSLAPSALLCAMLLAPAASARPAAHPAGAAAPSFTLAGRAGPVSLDSLRGRVVLVDFWASWCEPCRGSFPWLAALHARYAEKGLAIVAIDLDKRRDLADAFLAEFQPPFQVAFDPAGETAARYRVSAMPSSVLIGADGRVLYAHAGFDPGKTGPLEAAIREACAP